MTMSRDKKYGIAMLVTVILSVTNTIAAFVIGAWTLPVVSIPPSLFFVTTQIILIMVFITETILWATPE